MKLSNLLIITLFGSFFLIVSCGNKKEDPATDPSTISTMEAQDPSMTASTQTAGGTEFHYKCPNNCEGGGGSGQGKCPVCGTDMVHNPAFHSQQTQATPGSSPDAPIQVSPTTETGAEITQQTAQPGAQNAAGVWHYTCSKGCEGGAGAAGNCAKCGNPLTHNSAFHAQ
jgi:hypothetical protein